MIPGAGDCFGVKGEMCKPCPNPEKNECDNIKQTCDNLLCNPMCLALGLKCEVFGGGADFPAAQVGAALCGQAIAWACQDWKCCEEDSDELWDWVEDKTFDSAGHLAMVPEACKHDAVDEEVSKAGCDKCKASGITVVASKNEGACDIDTNPVPGGRRLLAYLSARRRLRDLGLLRAAMRLDARRRRRLGWRRGGSGRVGTPARPDPATAGDGSLLEVAEGSGGRLPNDEGFPGIGTMKSFKEMCEKVMEGITPGPISSKMDAKQVCECMGCCDPGDGEGYCIFPFYEQNGDPSKAVK